MAPVNRVLNVDSKKVNREVVDNIKKKDNVWKEKQNVKSVKRKIKKNKTRKLSKLKLGTSPSRPCQKRVEVIEKKIM